MKGRLVYSLRYERSRYMTLGIVLESKPQTQEVRMDWLNGNKDNYYPVIELQYANIEYITIMFDIYRNFIKYFNITLIQESLGGYRGSV